MLEDATAEVPLLPQPPSEPPADVVAREARYEGLKFGVQWLEDEMRNMKDAIGSGAMGTQNIEALMELRNEWEDIDKDLRRSSQAVREVMSELSTLIGEKHGRLTRQLQAVRTESSSPEAKHVMALPVNIESLEPVMPPGRRSRSNEHKVPLCRGTLGTARPSDMAEVKGGGMPMK